MLDNLYEDIGSKIKNWAKWIFIVEAVGAILTGLTLLIDRGLEDAWWALFIIIFGPIVAWVSSWILYAFGELVEDVHAIRFEPKLNRIDQNIQLLATSITQESKEKSQQALTKEDPHAEIPSSKNTIQEGSWTCGKCKKTNLNSRSDCWACGNPQ